MGYLIKAILGLALFFGAIVLFNVKLVELLETGTCASGNQPFVVARPCPEGTGTDILLLTVSVFAGLIGAGLFAFRGDPPWGSPRRSAGMFGLGTFAWGIFFTSTGAVMLLTAVTNDTIGEDGELGGLIVGITFLVMGVPALLIALWSLVRGLARGRDESPAAMAGSPAPAAAPALAAQPSWGRAGSPAAPRSGGDTISRLERLQRLRESGAITDSEFEREKARVLAEQ